MRLAGKVAIVTGSASGIGAAIAKGFLREGGRVVLADTNSTGAEDVARGSGSPTEQWMVKQLDVSVRSSVEECVTATVRRFGGLHIMVANAGIMVRKPFLELTDDEFDRAMTVNSKGVFLCSQAAARVMAGSGGGVIIHTSSISAMIATHENSVAYGASKGSVGSMTRHMAIDLAPHGIRVNAIAPGSVTSGLNQDRLSNPDNYEWALNNTPLRKIGTPEDIVGAAVFLASDESSFVTGVHLVVDGGWTAR